MTAPSTVPAVAMGDHTGPADRGAGALSVLLAVRDDLERNPGGDTVQVLNTAESLRRLRVRVAISSDPNPDLRQYDCMHIWHLERLHESLIFYEAAKRARCPVVLSPIYWPGAGWSTRLRRWRALLENGKNAVRFMAAESERERAAARFALRRGWWRGRRELLNGAHVLLANSRAEADVLMREGLGRVRVRTVPNAVDPEECADILARNGHERREGVLCVGYFDPRKNQLGLLEVMRGMNETLTLIGSARRNQRGYSWRCARAAGARVRLLGRLPHTEVLRAMGRARVHVCPSHCETPGLVNLEAAVMGCVLVVPDCPPVREYFGHEAIYFEPGSLASLHAAIETAVRSEPSPALGRRVLGELTWDVAAVRTREAYREVAEWSRVR